MIQKLRKKFVLVNMLLVSVVLLVVFGAVCFSSYHRLRREMCIRDRAGRADG